MLFAKENKAERTLVLHCEVCEHEQPAEDKCVFRNEMTLSASRLYNFQDVASDPTLPRANDVECAQCHHNEAVFMKDPVSKDSEGLTLHFICTNCKHNWKPGATAAGARRQQSGAASWWLTARACAPTLPLRAACTLRRTDLSGAG